MHFCEDYVSGTIEKEKTGSVLVMRFDLLPSSILYKFLEGIKVLPDLLFFSPNLRLGSFADLFEEKKTVPTDLQHILEIQRGRGGKKTSINLRVYCNAPSVFVWKLAKKIFSSESFYFLRSELSEENHLSVPNVSLSGGSNRTCP